MSSYTGMELSDDLKCLYRHWDGHVISGSEQGVPLEDCSVVSEEFKWFISERIRIWQLKSAGAKPPFTDDPILAQYRFCNIFREFDRQTIEFHTLLNPLRENFSPWLLNMFYCRMVARPETIHESGLLSFNESENRRVYERLMSTSRPRFGTPYVFPISTILKSHTPTRELFLTQYVPSVIERVAHEIMQWERRSVVDGLSTLLPLFKYNLSFLWTEVLIDVAYQFPERIDLFKRFPIGPGALPTFRAIDPRTDPVEVVKHLADYQVVVPITCNERPLRLSAENWEGIGCEYRKYGNLVQGRGRRRIYTPLT